MDDLCLLSQFYQWWITVPQFSISQNEPCHKINSFITVPHFSIRWNKPCHKINSYTCLNLLPLWYFTSRLTAEMQPRPSIAPHWSNQKACKNLLEPKALKFPCPSPGEFSTWCAWLYKNEILQLPTKSLCEDFLGGKVNFFGRVFIPGTPMHSQKHQDVSGSLFRLCCIWSDCRPAILAFRLSLLLRPMCWSFLDLSVPFGSWHGVCTVSHPQVMEVSSLSLVSYKCARNLWTNMLASWRLK